MPENAVYSSSTSPQQAVHRTNSEKFHATSRMPYFQKSPNTTEKGDGSGSNLVIAVNADCNPDLVLPRKKIKICNSDFDISLKDAKQNNTNDEQRANLRSNNGEETICTQGPSALCTLQPMEKFKATSSRELVHKSKPSEPGANPRSQEKGSPIIVSKRSSAPALEIIWKGCFEILNAAKLDGIIPRINRCEDLLAHPAATVSRKAYEFTKQIPGILQFKLYPRSDLWHGIFKTDTPDTNDIALYFYPSNVERSKKKYSILLKYIEKNDMVMRSSLGSVELMIFASTLLPSDFQKLDGSFFMWGVFRHSKMSDASN